MSSNAAEVMTSESESEKTAQPVTIDVPKLMSELRARVQAELAANPDQRRPFKSYSPEQNRPGHRRAGELINSEELYYLNTHWHYAQPTGLERITSHRLGIIGKAIVRVKRKCLSLVWEYLLKDYFEAEREYQSRLVQYLNAVSVYVDDRDGANFWELVRKIDYDVTKALTRIERIADEQGGNVRTLERDLVDTMNRSLRELNERITVLQGMVERGEGRLGVVESVASGVERVVGRLTREHTIPSGATVSNATVPDTMTLAADVPDQSYVLLENRYRGSEEEIARRLSVYPPVFAKDKGPVLEIGAGRGELQLLFREAGIPSYGVDLDRAMVSAAQERGASVEYGDGLTALELVADRSLGGVIAIQVVEHLTRAQLAKLFQLCAKKVVAGGSIVFETINPQSLLALSSNYFRDPTHIWPLHPDTLSFAMTMAGIEVKEIKMLSPVPEQMLLKKVPVEEYMTPRWAHAVDTINLNVERLNGLLFGYQDYAVIATSV